MNIHPDAPKNENQVLPHMENLIFNSILSF